MPDRSDWMSRGNQRAQAPRSKDMVYYSQNLVQPSYGIVSTHVQFFGLTACRITAGDRHTRLVNSLGAD